MAVPTVPEPEPEPEPERGSPRPVPAGAMPHETYADAPSSERKAGPDQNAAEEVGASPSPPVPVPPAGAQAAPRPSPCQVTKTRAMTRTEARGLLGAWAAAARDPPTRVRWRDGPFGCVFPPFSREWNFHDSRPRDVEPYWPEEHAMRMTIVSPVSHDEGRVS